LFCDFFCVGGEVIFLLIFGVFLKGVGEKMMFFDGEFVVRLW